MLNVARIPRTADELRDQVYLPDRRGSLQIDMLGGSRRHGAVPYLLAPELEALFTEVAAGHPVVVFQNLGLDFAPVWHYAVLIGYDLERGVVVLRSGEQARVETPLRTFVRTWARAGRWAMVAQPPRRLPATAAEQDWLRAALALEQAGQWTAAAEAYRAALARWPDNQAAQLGVGNARYARGDWRGAAVAFAQAAAAQPESGPAHNNLAQVLLGLGDVAAAHAAARRAVALGGEFAERYARTLEAVEQATDGAALGR